MLRITRVTALLVVSFIFAGCDQSAVPVVVADQPPAQVEQLSKVRAAVDQLRKDNAQNPDGPAKQAVDLQAGVAQSGLPEAKPIDASAAAWPTASHARMSS